MRYICRNKSDISVQTATYRADIRFAVDCIRCLRSRPVIFQPCYISRKFQARLSPWRDLRGIFDRSTSEITWLLRIKESVPSWKFAVLPGNLIYRFPLQNGGAAAKISTRLSKWLFSDIKGVLIRLGSFPSPPPPLTLMRQPWQLNTRSDGY